MSWRRTIRGTVGILSVGFWATSCAPLPPLASEPVTSLTAVHVQNRWLSLRLSRPKSGTVARPLVLFVTGDGGWGGKDLEAFHRLIEWGYPVVGVSAPDYLDHLAHGAGQLAPRQLARDLTDVVDIARAPLGLGIKVPVLLFGVSRGADLVVVAAAQRALRPSVLGVLAVGLTSEEEYLHRTRGKRSVAPTAGDSGASEQNSRPVHPYAALRRVAAPVSVIQSTNDEYITASEARLLFGPDSQSRRLQAIDARNHSFSDAREELYVAMRQSLLWISSPSVSNRRQVEP